MNHILLKSFLSLATVCSTGSPLYATNNVDTCVTSSGYTSVVEDLKELNMYSEEYLKIDNGINFITLSEQFDSSNKLKTFLYLSIADTVDKFNISVILSTAIASNNEPVTEVFNIYNTEVVSYDSSSSLCKYEITDLNNDNYSSRRYKLSSVTYKEESEAKEFKIDDVYYFTGLTTSSLVSYIGEIETITINDKQVACYCYGDSLNFFGKETGLLSPGNIYNDTWYVFFNTDKQIDNLLSLTIYYKPYEYSIYGKDGTNEMTDVITKDLYYDVYNNLPSSVNEKMKEKFYLNELDSVITTINAGTSIVSSLEQGWFSSKVHYETLDNIMNMKEYEQKSTDDSPFIFNEYADKYSWGVHFADTNRQLFTFKDDMGTPNYVQGTIIDETAILELTFETNNQLKTLPAVDIKAKDTDTIGEKAETPLSEDLFDLFNTETWFNNFPDWSKTLLKTIGIILGTILGLFVLIGLIKIISTIIRAISSMKSIKKRRK